MRFLCSWRPLQADAQVKAFAVPRWTGGLPVTAAAAWLQRECVLLLRQGRGVYLSGLTRGVQSTPSQCHTWTRA